MTAPDAPGAAAFRTAPDAYDRLMGRYSAGLADELVAAARVRPGHRALDVGCGPGALTSALAAALGAESVAAVDPSPPFVAACAERVPGRRRPGRRRRGPAVRRWRVRRRALAARRELRDRRAGGGPRDAPRGPAGRCHAAAVWDYADGMTLLRAFWDAALEVDQAGAPAHDEGRVMRWCTPAELERLWSGAGLRDVRGGELRATARYDGFADLWEAFERGVAPSGAYAAALEPRMRAGLRDALERRLGRPAGPFTLTARAWFVAGRERQHSSPRSSASI